MANKLNVMIGINLKHVCTPACGEDCKDKKYFIELTSAPHLLIGGTTGSGKSTLINTILSNLIGKWNRRQLQIYIGDPKRVEFSMYKNTSSVKAVVNSVAEHDHLLNDILVPEMEKRYEWMERYKVQNVVDDDLGKMVPNLVVVIDEFGTLVLDKMCGKRIAENLVRLVQLGRACGITVILATQHPTVQVVDTRIKANCPTRIAMKVTSAVNSHVILDKPGAETLRGRGHMYILSPYVVGMDEVQGRYMTHDQLSGFIEAANYMEDNVYVTK